MDENTLSPLKVCSSNVLDDSESGSTKEKTRMKCIICGIKWQKDGKIKFHRFPRNEELSDQWAKSLGLKYIMQMSAATRYCRYRVCSNHFKNSDYSGKTKSRLLERAVPSLKENDSCISIPMLQQCLKSKLDAVEDLEDMEIGEDKESCEEQAVTSTPKRMRRSSVQIPKTEKIEVLRSPVLIPKTEKIEVLSSPEMSEEQLLELDWVPIPNEPYIMKYVFSNSHYNIMVSNLTSLYNEKLEHTDIQKRFCKLNPYAQMKSQIILEKLKKSLQMCLTKESDLSLRFYTDKLVITLKLPVAHVLCNYDVEMHLMAADKVMQYVVSPTIFGALLSKRKVLELQKKNSAEISGASMSSNISVSSQNLIDPEWLKGQNVPIKSILDSFLEIQNHLKYLFAENNAAYSHFTKEKSKNVPQKKCRFQENTTDEFTSIKFEDVEQSIFIKEEPVDDDSTLLSDANSIIPAQSSKKDAKKKIFKI